MNDAEMSQGAVPAGGGDKAPEGNADELVARAIESVLEQVPAVEEEPVPEALARYQPWADTATPSAKNKRPLQALLDELTARVEAEPDAVAAAPQGKPPMLTYFDRFGSPRREGEGRTSRARRRRRGRTGSAAAPGSTAVEARTQTDSAASAPQPPQRRPTPTSERASDRGSRRRRRRRGRGGDRSGSGNGQNAAG